MPTTPQGRMSRLSDSKRSIWTPANVVTMVRVVFIPLWLVVAELSVPSDGVTWSASALVAALFFTLLSATDKVDGYLARSRDEVTTFGKFLDPIADKLLVIVGLCYLLEHGLVSAWVVLVVVAREFLVSGLRMVVASKGVVVAASKLGKWKTATTMVALVGLLLCRWVPDNGFLLVLQVLSTLALWIAVVLTAWSGIDYFVKCWSYVTEADDE